MTDGITNDDIKKIIQVFYDIWQKLEWRKKQMTEKGIVSLRRIRKKLDKTFKKMSRENIAKVLIALDKEEQTE